MALAISGSASAKDWVRIGMREKRAGNAYLTIGGAVVAHRNTAVGADSLRGILEWNVLRRRWALIRGRSHPIRFANGFRSLDAVCKAERLVSRTGADSRTLAPHSHRERDLARCSQRHLARCSQRDCQGSDVRLIFAPKRALRRRLRGAVQG